MIKILINKTNYIYRDSLITYFLHNKNANIQVLKYLIKKGANMFFFNKINQNCLWYAINMNNSNLIEIIRIFYKNGFDIKLIIPTLIIFQRIYYSQYKIIKYIFKRYKLFSNNFYRYYRQQSKLKNKIIPFNIINSNKYKVCCT